ncbi:probable L-cysteine desulfhydrase, chloroplastic [Chenopodium quinoa]|uniref:Aminotransferase class V domain-containing protein n=1 Tax=Chenopodium quinoa TaxID=63459 RepID=A0A803KN68_CHEQI|nr:probable L-cysteine desulfhydrase, chloroplastic [Chenopodium quinoa]XP_021772510.1 probable L-cysteine desulfhydrase, chloroplastic [Chenopodium quinoa]
MASNSSENGSHPKKPKLNHQQINEQTLISPSEIAAEFSHHDPTIARINNGSFGCCPSAVIAAQRRWQLLFLRQPDLFYFSLLRPGIDSSRRLLLPLINASRLDEISLVDNATTATAVVLQYVSRAFSERRFSPGDAAVMLHYAYGSVKKSVHAYVTRAGGHVIEVPLPFPVFDSGEIVREFRNALNLAKLENRRVRLAVIDHITSMPCVVLPVKELVKICREESVDQVFVDGAHAIGCLKIDMEEIGADFYTSNLHKWFFCPPSVAFLYCRKKERKEQEEGVEYDDVHHPVVSHEYGNGLPVESAWIGTRDYSSQLVVPEVLEFVSRFEGGIEGIMKRNHDKVIEIGEMLAKAWGTQLGCSPEMCASMVMVGLPTCLGIQSDDNVMKLRTHFREKFGVEVPIYFRPPKDGEIGCVTGYARISHQIYNTVDDYYKFRDAVNQLVQDGFTCAELYG